MPEIAEVVAAVEPVQTEPVETPVLPVKEHAARYSPEGRQKDVDARAAETTEQRTEREAKAQRARDESGKFQKEKHKAASQKASPDDVPRINQLTARAKTAEELARTNQERAERAERELATLRAQGAPKAEIARAEAKVDATADAVSTFKDPEPTEDDPKFAGDYSKYLRAVSAWEGRKAYHDEKSNERQAQERQQREQTQREALKTWEERNVAARQRYPDFDAVALEAPAPWLKPDGTAIPQARTLDAWIVEHKSGSDVLYYFQSEKNRSELDSLLAKPVLEQVEHLALLSQRLLPESSSQAGVTGAVAGRNSVVKLPPKPPTPVRTEAQRSSGGPPPTDGTLGVLGHAKAFHKTR